MKANPIRVNNKAEFERLCDRIDLEASHAAHHFYLLKALHASQQEYPLEMNESNTFWHLTFLAHRDSVLSHLCRLYDQKNGALSLSRFLRTVEVNPGLFSESEFRQRLKGNPQVEALVKNKTIDGQELTIELRSVSCTDPLVSQLWKLRNSAVSHLDANRIGTDAAHPWLHAQDIETLLERARNITSKYSLHFRASQHGGIAGADDYLATLRWVKKGLAHHRAQIDEELKRLGVDVE